MPLSNLWIFQGTTPGDLSSVRTAMKGNTDNPPYPMLVEYDVGDNPLRDLLVQEPIRPHKGALPIPKGPGLGLKLNPDIVAKYKV